MLKNEITYVEDEHGRKERKFDERCQESTYVDGITVRLIMLDVGTNVKHTIDCNQI